MKSVVNFPAHRVAADELVLNHDRAANEFMKGMSHELHTPLHVIIGLCQVLEREQNPGLSPVQRDSIERMERNARALLETVNHLLVCLRSGNFE